MKQLLRAALEGPDLWKRFARAVTGIVFIATPHTGSRLADAASAQRNFLGASTATVDLIANSPKLLELREWFAEYANNSGLLAVSYMETRKDPIFQRIIVSAESSWAGVGRTIAIDEDHVNIARPLSRTQPPYPAIMATLREWLPEVGGSNIRLDVDLSSAADGRAQILGQTSYSLRYRNIVGETVRLGFDRKLYPPPTVPRIARLLGHDSDGVLVDQMRRKRSVSFTDGDRLCDLFGVEKQWLDAGSGTISFEHRRLFSDPLDVLKSFYTRGVPYRKLFYVMCEDDDGTAAVYGMATDYRFDLLSSEIPIYEPTGGGGQATLEGFCTLLVSTEFFIEAGSVPLLGRAMGDRYLVNMGLILGKAEYDDLIYGHSHPAAVLIRNFGYSHWFEDLFDFHERGTYTKNYDAARSFWFSFLRRNGVTSNSELIGYIKDKLCRWQPADYELAEMLKQAAPDYEHREYQYYLDIVKAAHSVDAREERQQLLRLFDNNCKPVPDWLRRSFHDQARMFPAS